MKINWKNNYIQQLAQLTTLTWDGDLICKTHRDELVKSGYAEKINEFNLITANGTLVLINLGIIKI